MRNSRRLVVMLMFAAAACSKGSASSTDSTPAVTVAPPIDMSAEKAAILAADSAWFRAVKAKNVDSLMIWYMPDAVSYGFGAPAVGADKIRANYTEYVKSNMENSTINSGDVQFSADGTMAYDHGTYAVTVTPPGGKPTEVKGGYLNVWRKIDGKWRMVAEMSTPM